MHIIILENTTVVDLSVINPTSALLLLSSSDEGCCYIHRVERTNTNMLHIAEQPLKTHLSGKLEMLLMLGGAPLY